MTKLQRDAVDGILQRPSVAGRKRSTTRHSRYHLQRSLASVLVANSQGVYLNIRFPHQLLQFTKAVPAVIVSTIADDNDRMSLVSSLPNFLHSQVRAVIKCRAAFMCNKRKSIRN